MVVKARINACGLHLFRPVIDARERLRGPRNAARHNDGHVWRTEEVVQGIRNGARDATVSRRVFRMIGRCCKGRPMRMRNLTRVSVDTTGDSSYGPPEAVVVLGIPAADEGIRTRSIKCGEQPGGIGEVKVASDRQSACVADLSRECSGRNSTPRLPRKLRFIGRL